MLREWNKKQQQQRAGSRSRKENGAKKCVSRDESNHKLDKMVYEQTNVILQIARKMNKKKKASEYVNSGVFTR